MSNLSAAMEAWRRHLRAGTGLREPAIAAFVAEKLNEFGLNVTTCIGGAGVVATLRHGLGTRAIGLHAAMDALTMDGTPERARRPPADGRSHACGHDGHTASLLGTALSLVGEPNFDGIVRFIFQPAEEHGRGAQAMIDDGLLERFPMQEIYGIRTMPGQPVGSFATSAGPIMVAADAADARAFIPAGNAAAPTEAALRAATTALGPDKVIDDVAPAMPSEDFSRFLARVPGNVAFIGNGDGPALHNPAHDFNDAALPAIVAYYRALVADRLPLKGSVA